ncbi:MAG: BON domain-containing protein [Planctomycetaceae bacterium]|jgi:osmotically-inducible protein OsmY|nr:BON domain-containing protein [Planctomycetaceae bacterium]
MTSASAMDCPVSVGTEIQERMKQFLQPRMLTGAHVVQCEYKEGMLLIRGKVGSYYTKQLAQEYAKQIPGVEQVSNKLAVQKNA